MLPKMTPVSVDETYGASKGERVNFALAKRSERSVKTHLDGSLDALEAMRTKSMGRWPFDELEVSEGGELDGEVLERLVGLIDDEDIEEDVELVDVDVGLGVHGVGEARELDHAVEL